MRQTSKNVSPMSNEGRNLYVITHITESLLELLKDKPLNDISISELCSHAQVGRATFYRNFEVKEDVLNVYIHKLFSEWIDTYESNPPKTISQMVRELFLLGKIPGFLRPAERAWAHLFVEECAP